MPRPNHTHYPPFNFVACSSGYLLTSGHVRVTGILHMHSMTTPLKYYGASKVRHLSLSQAFRPSASQWNVLSRLLCALPIVLPLECALELVLEWNFPFRFNSSYASLDLLIELCHLSLLPITSEKTVFKDVQMK